MSERERLMELVKQSVVPYFAEEIADNLLENGIIVPTLKLGDKVWIIERRYGYETKSYEVVYIKYVKDCGGQLCYYSAMPFGKPILSINFNDRDIGKIVFLSKEEAEKSIEAEKHLKGGAE